VKKTYLKMTALIGIINLVVPISAVSKPEQKSLLDTPEIEVTDSAPIANNLANRVTLKLSGNGNEQPVLIIVRNMVSQIVENIDRGIAKNLVPDISSQAPATQFAEKLEIVIGVKTTLEVRQPYQVNITVSEPGMEGISRFFNYARSPSEIYQNLKDYLTGHLSQRLGFVVSQPVETEAQLQTPLNIGEEPQLQTPLIETPSVSGPQVEAFQPASVNHSVQSQALRVEKTTVLPQTIESQPISPKKEVQLKNISPVIKKISVKLQGSQPVQNVLDSVYVLINDILSRSRLGVVRIPVLDDPVTTPAIKISEHLEIVISAILPSERYQPYKVSLTLQPEGVTGQPQWFEYDPDNLAYFIQDLRVYLTKHLNLQPK
jgi:hypothetical protein